MKSKNDSLYEAQDMRKDRYMGIRVWNKKLHSNLYYFARHESRSANDDVFYLIRRSIAEFEATHGKIEINKDEKENDVSFHALIL